MNLVHIVDLFLFTHQFYCDVEHFLQGEICGILDRIWIIQEILSMNVAAFIVAAMNIPQIIECTSPESATFGIFSVFFALDLSLYSQILLRHFP